MKNKFRKISQPESKLLKNFLGGQSDQSFARSLMIMLTMSWLITISFLAAQDVAGEVLHETSPHLEQVRNIRDFADEYTVRPGDKFLIQPMFMEMEEFVTVVTLTGHLPLHVLTSPVMVAGSSLTEAKQALREAIAREMPNVVVSINLIGIAPYPVHITGAVVNPGEFIVDSLMTLAGTLRMADGLIPAASKEIKIIRRQQTHVYDLNKYLIDGDLNHNPLVLSNDLIRVDFAREFAKLHVVTDTINYIEYFEMEREKPVAELLPLIRNKYPFSDYQTIYLQRDDVTQRVEPDFIVRAGDDIYLNPVESYIIVRGNVQNPGKYNYWGGKTAQFYVSLAGGATRDGSSKRVRILSKDGRRVRDRTQELREGDTIIVPLSTRSQFMDYLTPISTSLSIILTFIIITN